MKSWRVAIVLMGGLCGGAQAHPQGGPRGDVEILWVRHDETVFNHYDRVQGWSDTPLTPAGEAVAHAVGVGAGDIRIDRYYSGDLGRQRETLAAIMRAQGINAPPVVWPALREVFFGNFEGLPNETMNAAVGRQLGLGDGQQVARLRQQGKVSLVEFVDAVHRADPRGEAETAQQVRDRLQQALENMVNEALQHGRQRLLVVSSGLAIGVMIADMTDNPRRNAPLGNGALVRIRYHDGHYQVLEVGDLHYARAGGRAGQ
ncbi:histidine phosphatase family protein [Pantoea sp. 1.19]|uniref:histidine phosphatase family protein n=1 Tax=Pantoea sp. 1.19 TaxID=1925589 RepID=UPI000948FAC6|nr:histidine phosphatase family protein [Pantoea sp. 1.19]